MLGRHTVSSRVESESSPSETTPRARSTSGATWLLVSQLREENDLLKTQLSRISDTLSRKASTEATQLKLRNDELSVTVDHLRTENRILRSSEAAGRGSVVGRFSEASKESDLSAQVCLLEARVNAMKGEHGRKVEAMRAEAIEREKAIRAEADRVREELVAERRKAAELRRRISIDVDNNVGAEAVNRSDSTGGKPKNKMCTMATGTQIGRDSLASFEEALHGSKGGGDEKSRRRERSMTVDQELVHLRGRLQASESREDELRLELEDAGERAHANEVNWRRREAELNADISNLHAELNEAIDEAADARVQLADTIEQLQQLQSQKEKEEEKGQEGEGELGKLGRRELLAEVNRLSVLLSRQGRETSRRLTTDAEWRKREGSARQEIYDARDRLQVTEAALQKCRDDLRKAIEDCRALKEERDFELSEAYLTNGALRKEITRLEAVVRDADICRAEEIRAQEEVTAEEKKRSVALADELSETLAAKDALADTHAESLNRIKELEGELKRITRERDNAVSRVDAVEAAATTENEAIAIKFSDEAKLLQASLARIEAEKDHAVAEREHAVATAATLEETLERTRAELASRCSEIEARRKEIESLQSELKAAQESAEGGNDEIMARLEQHHPFPSLVATRGSGIGADPLVFVLNFINISSLPGGDPLAPRNSALEAFLARAGINPVFIRFDERHDNASGRMVPFASIGLPDEKMRGTALSMSGKITLSGTLVTVEEAQPVRRSVADAVAQGAPIERLQITDDGIDNKDNNDSNARNNSNNNNINGDKMTSINASESSTLSSDIGAPSAPRINLENGRWIIRWDSVSGAKSYAIAYIVGSSAEWYKAWAGSATSFEYGRDYLGQKPGEYTFRVQGYDPTGIPGPWSDITKITV